MAWYDSVIEPLPINIWNLDKAGLVQNLEKASTTLQYMEYVVDDRYKAARYREKIDKMIEILELPDTAYSNWKSTVKIAKAVADLRKINVYTDQERAAYAFGRLFAGIGELARYLPPPINGYFEIFAEAEMFFVNMRAKMQPEVHMREPGLREAIDDIR